MSLSDRNTVQNSVKPFYCGSHTRGTTLMERKTISYSNGLFFSFLILRPELIKGCKKNVLCAIFIFSPFPLPARNSINRHKTRGCTRQLIFVAYTKRFVKHWERNVCRTHPAVLVRKMVLVKLFIYGTYNIIYYIYIHFFDKYMILV